MSKARTLAQTLGINLLQQPWKKLLNALIRAIQTTNIETRGPFTFTLIPTDSAKDHLDIFIHDNPNSVLTKLLGSKESTHPDTFRALIAEQLQGAMYSRDSTRQLKVTVHTEGLVSVWDTTIRDAFEEGKIAGTLNLTLEEIDKLAQHMIATVRTQGPISVKDLQIAVKRLHIITAYPNQRLPKGFWPQIKEVACRMTPGILIDRNTCHYIEDDGLARVFLPGEKKPIVLRLIRSAFRHLKNGKPALALVGEIVKGENNDTD